MSRDEEMYKDAISIDDYSDQRLHIATEIAKSLINYNPAYRTDLLCKDAFDTAEALLRENRKRNAPVTKTNNP